jgi:hypothetical protein
MARIAGAQPAAYYAGKPAAAAAKRAPSPSRALSPARAARQLAMRSPLPEPRVVTLAPTNTVPARPPTLAERLAASLQVPARRPATAGGRSSVHEAPSAASLTRPQTGVSRGASPLKNAVRAKLVPAVGARTAKPLKFVTAEDEARREMAARQRAISSSMTHGGSAFPRGMLVGMGHE